MTYPLDAIAILRSQHPVAVGRRSRSRQNVLDAEPGPDPHAPAQRAAIERKRAATEERDRRRFLAATAHMADEEFSILPGDDNPLIAGLGRHRDADMTLRWIQEPDRRARRTAHEILSERRLYGRP